MLAIGEKCDEILIYGPFELFSADLLGVLSEILEDLPRVGIEGLQIQLVLSVCLDLCSLLYEQFPEDGGKVKRKGLLRPDCSADEETEELEHFKMDGRCC